MVQPIEAEKPNLNPLPLNPEEIEEKNRAYALLTAILNPPLSIIGTIWSGLKGLYYLFSLNDEDQQRAQWFYDHLQ